MTLDDAMRAACASVGIIPPASVPIPGRWKRTNTLERNGKGDASVLIFDDQQGGIAYNWQTSQKQPFRIDRATGPVPPPRRDPEKERRRAAEQAEVERVCAGIVAACRQEPHPYLTGKGFPDELGLVHDNPYRHFPDSSLGEGMAHAMLEGPGPFLIVPGRIGKRVTTVQFVAPSGEKKNIYRGVMGGASHRIASGRQTVVCEGIATALSVRAALRLLGVSATVLSAFSASNVALVASGIPGAFIAADHDKPVDAFGGLGTGEYYALRSGLPWGMPPEPGDWNDHHATHGLRDVALRLRAALHEGNG